MENRLASRLAAEFIGTALLVLLGCGAIVASVETSLGLLGIAIAFGLTVAVVVSTIGHLSGGHINPAVTLALWAGGKFSGKDVVPYIGVQLAGATAGAFLLRAIFPEEMWRVVHLGTTLPGPGVGMGTAVLVEVVLTFVLVLVVFGTAVDERGTAFRLAGIPIGFAVSVDILMGGVLTGASMNPARSFGPALASGTWASFGVYIIGPVIGGVLAAVVYRFLFMDESATPASDV